jgi:hypothetical protein
MTCAQDHLHLTCPPIQGEACERGHPDDYVECPLGVKSAHRLTRSTGGTGVRVIWPAAVGSDQGEVWLQPPRLHKRGCADGSSAHMETYHAVLLQDTL